MEQLSILQSLRLEAKNGGDANERRREFWVGGRRAMLGDRSEVAGFERARKSLRRSRWPTP